MAGPGGTQAHAASSSRESAGKTGKKRNQGETMHTDSSPNTIATEEQKLRDNGAECCYRQKFARKDNAVIKLQAMLFPAALSKGIKSSRPLSQPILLSFSTSNDVAPFLAHLVSAFVHDKSLVLALRLACPTLPSVGKKLEPLAKRIMKVVRATLRGTTHAETNSALIELAKWVVLFYRKCHSSFFQKLNVSQDNGLLFCSRYLLVVFEDLAFGEEGFFAPILSSELAVPMLLRVRKKVEAKYELNLTAMVSGDEPLDFFADDTEAVDAANVKALTSAAPAQAKVVNPPFSVDEQLAFCKVFQDELKENGDNGHFCVRKISAVLPLRSEGDVISFYNANRHIYGLALRSSTKGKSHLEHRPSTESVAIAEEHSSKRRKIGFNGFANAAPGSNIPMADGGSNTDNTLVQPDIPKYGTRARGITSPLTAGDLRFLARNLISKDDPVHGRAGEIMRLEDKIDKSRSYLIGLIDKAGDSAYDVPADELYQEHDDEVHEEVDDGVDDEIDEDDPRFNFPRAISETQQQIKLMEGNLLFAKKQYQKELTDQLGDHSTGQWSQDSLAVSLREQLIEQQQQHRTDIEELRRLQTNRVNEMRIHYEEELTSQKSAFEAKLHTSTNVHAAPVRSGLISDGSEPMCDSSDLATQVETLTQQLNSMTLQLGTAKADLDESRTSLGVAQTDLKDSREEVAKLQKSLQDLSIKNSNGNEAYDALHSENSKLQNQNRLLKQQNASLTDQIAKLWKDENDGAARANAAITAQRNTISGLETTSRTSRPRETMQWRRLMWHG
ncbi:hypothetical protein HII31_02989 [Pseudocercospora fuligena]|uniref:Uncharacterized protein n=1 Tax=Pseudocercospora fuligena TaxID=685502 RepID=A0A8H6RR84_9PEZI|nr:hypothetical protein HII31_02989 [Pseudocercospora fuligena]